MFNLDDISEALKKYDSVIFFPVKTVLKTKAVTSVRKNTTINALHKRYSL